MGTDRGLETVSKGNFSEFPCSNVENIRQNRKVFKGNAVPGLEDALVNFRAENMHASSRCAAEFLAIFFMSIIKIIVIANGDGLISPRLASDRAPIVLLP